MPEKTVSVADLRVCAWRTVSLGAREVEAIRAVARASHPGAAFVESCQRFEAYRLAPCACDAPEQASGAEALARLAEVAAGLHSVVLGESQIMGQVRAAFEDAPPGLRSLADIAVASARELRRRERFESHAGHLLDRALTLAEEPARGRLLVLGAGAMGKLVAQRALELGFEDVLVAARRKPAGNAFAGCAIVPLAEVARIAPVDVVAGCLGSGAAELQESELPAIRCLAIDLGTPRNFGQLLVRTVRISDMLADEASRLHARRRREALQTGLREIVAKRFDQQREDAASPIGALRRAVEEVRQRELGRMRRLHPEVAPETLEALTRSLVNQIFHAPSARLRTMDDPQLGRTVAALFRQ